MGELKREQAMLVISRLSNEHKAILMEAYFESWVSRFKEEKKEAEFMKSKHVSEELLKKFKEEKKAQGTKVVSRMCRDSVHLLTEAIIVVTRLSGDKDNILMESVFIGWTQAASDQTQEREEQELRSSIESQIGRLQTLIRDKDEEIEDLTEELAESRRKTRLLRSEMNLVQEYGDRLNESVEEMLRDD